MIRRGAVVLSYEVAGSQLLAPPPSHIHAPGPVMIVVRTALLRGYIARYNMN
jgi:hypothetical protein